jgi:L-asparaginase II
MRSESGPSITTPLRNSAVPLSAYSRNGHTEGVFYGHAVVLDPDGSVVSSWGSATQEFYPRSSNKIGQASAMAGAGLCLPQHLQALTAASHSGEQFHLDGVLEILASANLTPAALQTPEDYPLDAVERDACIVRGEDRSPILMNCSGKHAGMLATCVINGWDIETYLAPDHPLQLAMTSKLEEMSGEPIAFQGVDGCGAPVHALTLPGLARLAQAAVLAAPGSPERLVADAMRAHPEYVGGTRRDVTHFMAAIPGLLAKDGAFGVYTAAFDDGRAVALKIESGAESGRNAAMAGLFMYMGVPESAVEMYSSQPVLGGGKVVGSIYPTLT